MEGEYLSLDTAKKIEAVKKVKAILPEGVEAVVISKDDYDRLSGELTKENIELKLEIERLNNIINESRRILGEYKHYSTPDEIQNMFNEEIVDKAYIKLHSNLQELKGSDKE